MQLCNNTFPLKISRDKIKKSIEDNAILGISHTALGKNESLNFYYEFYKKIITIKLRLRESKYFETDNINIKTIKNEPSIG